MMGFGMGFGLIGLLIMLLFWGGLILLAVWLVKMIFSGSQSHHSGLNTPPGGGLDAREILAQRYARGEITREQYETMKQDIS
jgi:putative membrane protein